MLVKELIEAYIREISSKLSEELAHLTVSYIINSNPTDFELCKHGTIDIVDEITNMKEALTGAAASNNVDLISYIKDVYYDPNVVLRGACMGGNRALMNLALSEGALAVRGLNGAISTGRIDLARELISKGANPESCMSGAVLSCDPNMVKFVRSIGCKEVVAIHLISHAVPYTSVIKYLIAENTNVFHPVNCFMLAYQNNNRDLMDFYVNISNEVKQELVLMCEADYTTYAMERLTKPVSLEDLEECLYHAYKNNNHVLIEELSKRTTGEYAIIGLCHNENANEDLALELFQKGYNVHCLDVIQFAKRGLSRLVEAVLAKGNGRPCAQQAIKGALSGKHFELAEKIIKDYPDTKLPDTCIIDTEFTDANVELFTKLISMGANIKGCIDYIVRTNQQELIKVYMKSYKYRCRTVPRYYNISAFDLMFNMGLHPDCVLRDIVIKKYEFNREMLDHAIEAGATPDLHISNCTTMEMFKYLVSKGANPYLPNSVIDLHDQSSLHPHISKVRKILYLTKSLVSIRYDELPEPIQMPEDSFSKFVQFIEGEGEPYIPEGIHIDYLAATSIHSKQHVIRYFIDKGANPRIFATYSSGMILYNLQHGFIPPFYATVVAIENLDGPLFQEIMKHSPFSLDFIKNFVRTL